MCSQTNIQFSIPVDCSGNVKIGYKLGNWANDYYNVLANHVYLISAESKFSSTSPAVRLCDQRVCDCKTCVSSCTKAKVHAIQFRWFGSAAATKIVATLINANNVVVGTQTTINNCALKGLFLVENIPQSAVTIKLEVWCGSAYAVYTSPITCSSLLSGQFLPATCSSGACASTPGALFFVEQVSTNRPLSVTFKINANNALYGSNVTVKVMSSNNMNSYDATKAKFYTNCAQQEFTHVFGDEDEGAGFWIYKNGGGTDDYNRVPLDCSSTGNPKQWDWNGSAWVSRNTPVVITGLNCGKRNLCDKRYPCTRPCNTRPRHGGKGLKGSTGEGQLSSGASKGKWNPWNQVPGEDKKKQIELDTFNHAGSKKGRKYKNSSGMKSSGNTGSTKGSWGSKPTHMGCDAVPVYDIPRQCCDGEWKCKSALLDYRIDPSHRYYLLALSRDCNCHFDDICITEVQDSAVNVTEWANGIWKGYGTPKSNYKQSSGSKGTRGGHGSYIHKAEGAAQVDQASASASSPFGVAIPSTALVAIGVAVLGTVLLAGVVAMVIRSVRRRRQLQAEVQAAMADAATA